jgi:hypothetical protein
LVGKLRYIRVGRLGEARERNVPCAGERDCGEVVGIPRVGKHDRPAAFDGAERELHQACLRSRQHRDLACGVDVHAVHLAVALPNRLLQRGKAGERGVAVDVGPRRRLREGVHDVRRRARFGISATEVDERLALLRSGCRDARQEPREVLPR